MRQRADRFALVAAATWLVGAEVSRRCSIWLGLGLCSVTLGAAALAFDVGGVRRLLRPSLTGVALGGLTGVLMALATYLLYPVAVHLVPAVALETDRLYVGFAAIPPTGAALALAPVIFGEELVWRGIVEGAVAQRAGLVAAVLLAAFAYGLAHAPLGSALLVFVAVACGLVWGALRALTGGLVAPLVAHLVWDTSLLFVHPLVGR